MTKRPRVRNLASRASASSRVRSSPSGKGEKRLKSGAMSVG